MRLIKVKLIAVVVLICFYNSGLFGQERERLYKIHSYTSSSNPSSSPFNYLELFTDGTFKWYKAGAVVRGGYTWDNKGNLLLKSLKPADGEVTGDKSKGKVVFRWHENDVPKVLEMCIASGMTLTSQERCQ